MSIDHLVDTGGYLAVAGLVCAECIGVPLPGETVLIAAATYAGATHHLSIWLIFVVAVAAAAVGGFAGYGLGSWGGYRLVRRWGRVVRVDEAKLKVARYLCDRHGGKMVFFGRFVSILRAYAAFLAGVARMRFARFAVANVCGAVAWSALYTFVAYNAGKELARLSTPIDLGIGVVVIALVAVGILALRHRMVSLVAAAEAAYPGPLEA